MRMYDQMFNDINTHILVVWQSVGVLVGAFAILALTEKQIITLDIAASLIVLIAAWLIGHLYDASYWYNRNLVIIANIERQFLTQSDLRDVHYYFGKHRRKGSMIMHLKIQYALALGIAFIVVVFHFFARIASGIGGQCAPLRETERRRGRLTVVVTCLTSGLSRVVIDYALREFETHEKSHSRNDFGRHPVSRVTGAAAGPRLVREANDSQSAR